MTRLAEREAGGKSDVALRPLPTGAHDLRRLRGLFRYDVFRRHYGRGPGTAGYLDAAAERVAAPSYLDDELAALAAELGKSSRGVYLSREQIAPDPDDAGGEP